MVRAGCLPVEVVSFSGTERLMIRPVPGFDPSVTVEPLPDIRVGGLVVIPGFCEPVVPEFPVPV